MKKISIIVPAYNEEESIPYLEKRLVALMDNMKNYEFEVLFVNDGSKDKTLELIKELRERDERFCYVNFHHLLRQYYFIFLNSEIIVSITWGIDISEESTSMASSAWHNGAISLSISCLSLAIISVLICSISQSAPFSFNSS